MVAKIAIVGGVLAACVGWSLLMQASVENGDLTLVLSLLGGVVLGHIGAQIWSLQNYR